MARRRLATIVVSVSGFRLPPVGVSKKKNQETAQVDFNFIRVSFFIFISQALIYLQFVSLVSHYLADVKGNLFGQSTLGLGSRFP